MGAREILIRYLILFSSHLFSILTPLIIFPILVQRLGETGFGKVLLVQSIITYFTVLVDYDFNLWGVRELARGKSQSETYGNVVHSKLQLTIISIVIYLGLSVLIFDKIGSWSLIMSGLAIILSYALNPLWFFQGQEKIWSMALVNMFSKLIFLCGSYVFIHSLESAWIYNLSFGLGLLIPGLYVFYRHFSWRKLRLEYKRGFDIFSSNFSILVYSNASPLWVGLIMPVSAVTEFSVAERLVFAARGFMSLYAQVIYPKICQESNPKDHQSLVRSHYVFIFLTFTGGLVCAYYADLITAYFIRDNNGDVVSLVQVSSFLPTIIVSNIYPYQWLLAHSHYRFTRKILISGAIIGLFLFPIGVFFLKLWGAVLASFIVEFFISASLIWMYLRLRKGHVSVG